MKLLKPKDKIKSISKANRKERVVKPSKTSPPEFYTGSRFGFGWCDECEGNNVNVLNGLVLTCNAGHSRELLPYVEKEVTDKSKGKVKKVAEGDTTPALFFV